MFADCLRRISGRAAIWILFYNASRAGLPHRGVHSRLELHLLASATEAPPSLVEAYLLNDKHLRDSEVFHEYSRLVGRRYSEIGEGAKKHLLKLIHERGGYQERALLSLIAKDLDPNERKSYETLIEEDGTPKHPEFLSFTTASFGFVGYTSSHSAEELGRLELDELHDLLESFKPTSNPFEGPTPEGIARELMKAVEADPCRFGAKPNLLLFSEPTFSRAIVQGFERAVMIAKPIPWEAALELSGMILDMTTNGEPAVQALGRDPDWSYSHEAVLSLVRVGLRPEGKASIPASLRDRVWRIIKTLARIPLPMSVLNAKGDFVAACLNSLRGQTLECVLEFVAWESPDGLADGFKPLPEVREALEVNAPCPHSQKSLAIHAFFGLKSTDLFLLDAIWTTSMVPEIFPQIAALSSFREAAWDSFITYSSAHPRLFRISSF